MNIKKRRSAFLTCILFPVICLLLPVTCLADYDTNIAADGSEVKDTVTGLIWRRCSEGQEWSGNTCTGTAISLNHENAFLRAKSQAATSGKAWRAPNVKELSSITKLGIAMNPSIDTTVFPATPSKEYWTSTPYASDSNSVWLVYFDHGSVDYSSRRGPYYLRLVR